MARKPAVPEAKQVFEKELASLLKPSVTRLHPESPKTQGKVLTIPTQPLDTRAVAELFEEYGMHLRLMGGRAPIEESRFFEWTAPSAK